MIGHADRAGPLRDYCLGLIMPCERKSVEPMAAVTAPDRTAAQHQSLLHFVGQSPWSDEKVLTKVGEMVLPAIESHGPIEAWIIDDTGFPKKGEHSVGVARQYCGQLGKRENCQVAVSLSLANHHASLPVAWRLYLPKEWAADQRTSAQGGRPRRDRLQDQARDRARADRSGLKGRAFSRRGPDGCGLWLQHGSACRHQRARVDLCGRYLAAHHGVDVRHGTATAEKMVGPRATTEAHSSRRQASTDLGQGARSRPPQALLAQDRMARGYGRAAVLALCSRAGSCRASRLRTHGKPAGRMAVDRMAKGRGRADQILAFNACRKTSPSAGWWT